MKNKYIIEDNTVKIILNRRQKDNLFTIIDKDDFKKVDAFEGTFYPRAYPDINGYYATICLYLGIINGKPKYKNIRLHRIILDYYNLKYDIDHINNDPLDNRRENLRIVDKKNNSRNRIGKNSNNTTGYRNVTFYEGYYIVQLQVDGKNKRLGKFKDVDEAGVFAEKMRKKFYKEFSGSN